MSLSPKAKLAVVFAKTVAFSSRFLAHHGGTNLPGALASKLCGDLLHQLGLQIQGPKVGITGTNGKTTTAGLLASIWQGSGVRVVHNQLGANMLHGVTTALALQQSLFVNKPAQGAVLEMDEASLAAIVKAVPVDHLVVTNLFRDQLDRYGELDTTAQYIAKGFAQVKNTLWLNADDPLVANLAQRLEKKTNGPEGLNELKPQVAFFGVNALSYANDDSERFLNDAGVPFPQEVSNCPVCNHELAYNKRFYAQLGHYACPACGYSRPKPDLEMTLTHVNPDGAYCQFVSPALNINFTLEVNLPGVFNLYNLLAAVAPALALELKPQTIRQSLTQYHSVFGRAERREVVAGGKAHPVSVLLIKNPAGATEVLRLVAADPKARVLFAINDNYADGRDISWLWDTPFEWLVSGNSIGSTGSRAEDMAVRLKYAGQPEQAIWIEPKLKAAVTKALAQLEPGQRLYILPTYTALLELNGLWEKL